MDFEQPMQREDIPDWEDFREWPSEQVQTIIGPDKTVIFAPGGTSRWYFLHHGEVSQGYTQPERFQDYAVRSMLRVIEIANMMFDDGIKTMFAAVYVPAMTHRDEEYLKNLSWVYDVMVEESTQELYKSQQMSVLFRGNWQRTLELVGSKDLSRQFDKVEKATARNPCRLIWLTEEAEPIPPVLTNLVADHLAQTGELPARASMAAAYYGFPLSHADIFIGHNKPTLGTLIPPLLTLGDLYYTVTPSLSMSRPQWRKILYDHLFSRRGWFRDYRTVDEEAIHTLHEFYQQQDEVVLGVGKYYEKTQTWHPDLDKGRNE